MEQQVNVSKSLCCGFCGEEPGSQGMQFEDCLASRMKSVGFGVQGLSQIVWFEALR